MIWKKVKRVKKRRKKHLKSLALIIAAAVMLGSGLSCRAASKVYMSVEKFTIGQGYLVEPTVMTVTDGEALSAVTERLLKQKGFSYTVEHGSMGWYLAGIDKADSGGGYVPGCIQKINAGTGDNPPKTADILPAETKNGPDYPGLYEKSYTMYSGWMFYPNNQDMSVGAENFLLKDGDVVRLRFSLYGYGLDLGNGRTGSLSLPNLDTITRRMAVYNANKKACDAKGYASAYANAKSIVTNMDQCSQTRVEDALKKLPTESQMIQWGKDLEAKTAADKKAAAAVTAKINAIGKVTLAKKTPIAKARAAYNALNADAKKLVSAATVKKLITAEKKLASLEKAAYTPAKVRIKKAVAGKKKVKLTWKIIKKATGYQIYMSTKKRSGFKKIATKKKARTVTYTKKKLKSKKTYYFRVRAYRKVGKKFYYGPYSPVKKVKVK